MKDKEIKRVTKYCIPGVTLTNKGDYWQIRKIGLTGETVKKDPKFANTRKQAKKFTQAAEWAKRINDAVLRDTNLKQSLGRLAGVLVKAMPPGFQESDSVFKGLVENGDALVGFEFNEQVQWKDIQNVQYRSTWVPQYRKFKFYLKLSGPTDVFKPPEGITHYRIQAIALTINKNGHMILGKGKRTTLLPWKEIKVQQISLEVDVNVGSEQVCLALLHMQWYRPTANDEKIVPASMPGALTITDIYKS